MMELQIPLGSIYDSSTTDWSRLLKLSGENGSQGSADITLKNNGIVSKSDVYANTSSTWVHLKINYDVNGNSVTKTSFY